MTAVEVDACSPWLFAGVAATLVATAILAAWIQARRAARTDPPVVLRSAPWGNLSLRQSFRSPRR